MADMWLYYCLLNIILNFWFFFYRRRWKRMGLMGKRKMKEKNPIRVKNVVPRSGNLHIWSNTCKVIPLRYFSFAWFYFFSSRSDFVFVEIHFKAWLIVVCSFGFAYLAWLCVVFGLVFDDYELMRFGHKICVYLCWSTNLKTCY